MATKEEWREYFELTEGRKPTFEEFQAALKNGEITADTSSENLSQSQSVSEQASKAITNATNTVKNVLASQQVADLKQSGKNLVTSYQKRVKAGTIKPWQLFIPAIVIIGFIIWGGGSVIKTQGAPNGTYHISSNYIGAIDGVLSFTDKDETLTFNNGTVTYQDKSAEATYLNANNSGNVATGSYTLLNGYLTINLPSISYSRTFKYSKNLFGKIELNDTSGNGNFDVTFVK